MIPAHERRSHRHAKLTPVIELIQHDLGLHSTHSPEYLARAEKLEDQTRLCGSEKTEPPFRRTPTVGGGLLSLRASKKPGRLKTVSPKSLAL